MPDSASPRNLGQHNVVDRRPLLAVVSVLLLALGGCEQQQPKSLASARQQSAALDPTQRPKGWYQLSQAAGRIQLSAHEVPRSTLLKALGEAANFTVHGLEQLSGTFTGTIDTDRPTTAAQLIAREKSITLQLEWRDNQHQLSSLHLSRLHHPVSVKPQTEAAQPVSDNNRLLQQWQEDFGYAHQMLQAEDAANRIKALDDFPAQGDGLLMLGRALRRESEPEVRIELLHKLDESGSLLAKTQTLSALTDTNPEVITAAVQLIAEWHDEEVTQRYLLPLRQHTSATVRNAVTAAVDRVQSP